ncbi:DUF6461 domain-containing protein [Nocardia arthritidis]|uniref:Uncharacterized protein n=1 Tax=Nocardia arthritidis TaxID=228602 RepID=A0A6G9YFM7_9NOCA|nr:DUF6461 domain-containing protein [Nocardia arthritidis]QIS11783.1 hypothetical protein F5544_19575 [Nocardia arthritidis]
MSSNRGRSNAVAADYDWIKGDDLYDAFCLTLVRGVTPQEFMDRIGARITFGALPFGAEFTEIAFDCWDKSQGDVLFIGATTVAGAGGDWTLAFERNGYLGQILELMAPLSAGSRLVTVFNSMNTGGYFHWFEDGDLRLRFEAIFAYDRWGSTPDACLEYMKQIGFNLNEDREDIGPTITAALALAERCTGVRVTDDMLYGADFLCGTARDPRRT